MRIETDRALIPASAESVRYLTVGIATPDTRRRPDRAAANVTLVLDRSGSMDGRKIEMARAAVAHAIKLLDGRDHLAVVVYDNDVEVILESTNASPEAKALALKRLAAVDARGGTDLCAGWSRGIEEGEQGTSRVLLLTDGLANEGITDHDELVRMAAAFRAKGITTSTFGIGADFDETLLSRLATEGGGHFYFIETPRQIPDFLTSELGETLEVVAPDAEFVISAFASGFGETSPSVAITLLNEFPVEVRPDGLHVKLGDLVAGQDVKLVVALRWPAFAFGFGEARGNPEGATAVADCRVTDRAGKLFPQPMRVEWTAANAAADAAQPVNSPVLVAAAELIAARASAAALAANRAGRFQDAKGILDAAVASLRALANGIPEINAIISELEREQPDYLHAMEPLAMKTRHFASHNVARGRDKQGKARRSAAGSS